MVLCTNMVLLTEANLRQSLPRPQRRDGLHREGFQLIYPPARRGLDLFPV